MRERTVLVIVLIFSAMGIIVAFNSGYMIGYAEPKTIRVETLVHYNASDSYKSMFKLWVGHDPESIPKYPCIFGIYIKTDSDVGMQVNISQNDGDHSEFSWEWQAVVVGGSELIPGGAGWYWVGGNRSVYLNPTLEKEFTLYDSRSLNSNYSYYEPIELEIFFFGNATDNQFDCWQYHTIYVTTLPRY